MAVEQSDPPRALGRTGRQRLRVLLTLGSLSALAPISTDIYLPGLPGIGCDLGASTTATQATLSGCLIGLAIGQVIAGPASDVLGRRRPLVAGISAYAVLSVLCEPTQAVAEGLDVGPRPGDDRPDGAPGDAHQLGDRALRRLGSQPRDRLVESDRVPGCFTTTDAPNSAG